MYRQVADFLADYHEEVVEAQKNWDRLTDESLNSSPGNGFWTIREHLWHIASLWQYVFVKDLQLWPPEDFLDHTPSSAKSLAGFYGHQADKAIHWIEQNWGDEELAGVIEIWGMQMPRGKLLWEIVKHEAHHRGQIFVLMRLAGLPVHGIYGPSKEEVLQMSQQSS
ncbi:DinB family protein [bacterium]|nr:DinB family protein [bacterium]